MLLSIGCSLQDDYINMTAKLIQHIQTTILGQSKASVVQYAMQI